MTKRRSLIAVGFSLSSAVLLILSSVLVVNEIIRRPFTELLPMILSSLEIFVGFSRHVTMISIVQWGGLLAVPVVIFVETGLLFGFFLPGDSLLLTVGILASTGHIDLWVLVPLTILAAVGGDQVGYVIGLQSALACRYSFVQSHLLRARVFYERHGGMAIVAARFLPIVRTLAPVVAGASGMRYRNFVTYNIAGGVLWVVSLTLSGYVLGRTAPSFIPVFYPLIGIIVTILIVTNIIVLIRKTLPIRNHSAPPTTQGPSSPVQRTI